MGACLYTHFLPHCPDQLYDLVADIEKYPEFLPWCLAVRIISVSDLEIIADLSAGYKIFRETFRSRVRLTPKSRIDVDYIDGPFHNLTNYWTFKESSHGDTKVDFFIDFQFRSAFFQNATQTVFESAFNTMLGAFEKRAQHVYGESHSVKV